MAELTTSELFEPQALLGLLRRTAPGGVLSIYVDADSGTDAGLQGAAIDIKNRLAQLERNIAADGPRERAQGLHDGIERLAPEIERLTNPQEPGRGRALFAPLGDGEVIRFSSQMPLANRVVLDASAFIHSPLELLDEGRQAGVLLISQDEARLLEWRLAELRPLSSVEPDAAEAPHERPGPVGSSPVARRGPPRRAAPGPGARPGASLRRPGGGRRLAARRRARLGARAGQRRRPHDRAGGRRADQTAGHRGHPRSARPDTARPANLSATVTENLHAQHDEYEARLVRDARQAALGSGAGALGLSEVVGALNEGRVTHLVYDPEIRYQGSIGRTAAAWR